MSGKINEKQKISSLFLMIQFSLFAVVLVSNSFAQVQQTINSVVQIESNKVKRGVGVAVYKPDYIITALHVVAGVPEIKVYSKFRGRRVPADIVRVHKESDLALLKLRKVEGRKSLNLYPLQISEEIPYALNDYLIYGYDKIPNVQERQMALSSNTHLLTSIIEPTSKQYNWLLDNGFPSPSATIIRLDDPIQHGDSGSPITDANGKLIEIGRASCRERV